MPGNGSCLYEAVVYVMRHARFADFSPSELRELLATWIVDNRLFNVADVPILKWIEMETNETVAEYVTRMRTSAAWGGPLELAALAYCFNCSVDVYVQNADGFIRTVCFCDPSQSKQLRIDLLYNGVHYDVLHLLDAPTHAAAPPPPPPATAPPTTARLGRRERRRNDNKARKPVEADQLRGSVTGEARKPVEAEQPFDSAAVAAREAVDAGQPFDSATGEASEAIKAEQPFGSATGVAREATAEAEQSRGSATGEASEAIKAERQVEEKLALGEARGRFHGNSHGDAQLDDRKPLSRKAQLRSKVHVQGIADATNTLQAAVRHLKAATKTCETVEEAFEAATKEKKEHGLLTLMANDVRCAKKRVCVAAKLRDRCEVHVASLVAAEKVRRALGADHKARAFLAAPPPLKPDGQSEADDACIALAPKRLQAMLVVQLAEVRKDDAKKKQTEHVARLRARRTVTTVKCELRFKARRRKSQNAQRVFKASTAARLRSRLAAKRQKHVELAAVRRAAAASSVRKARVLKKYCPVKRLWSSLFGKACAAPRCSVSLGLFEAQRKDDAAPKAGLLTGSMLKVAVFKALAEIEAKAVCVLKKYCPLRRLWPSLFGKACAAPRCSVSLGLFEALRKDDEARKAALLTDSKTLNVAVFKALAEVEAKAVCVLKKYCPLRRLWPSLFGKACAAPRCSVSLGLFEAQRKDGEARFAVESRARLRAVECAAYEERVDALFAAKSSANLEARRSDLAEIRGLLVQIAAGGRSRSEWLDDRRAKWRRLKVHLYKALNKVRRKVRLWGRFPVEPR
jgi:hypothetical protein